jgi:hypothetical protein
MVSIVREDKAKRAEALEAPGTVGTGAREAKVRLLQAFVDIWRGRDMSWDGYKLGPLSLCRGLDCGGQADAVGVQPSWAQGLKQSREPEGSVCTIALGWGVVFLQCVQSIGVVKKSLFLET